MAENVVLFASYPKTGSTWLRKLLTELVCPGGVSDEVVPSFLKAFPGNAPVFPVMGTHAQIVKTHLWPGQRRFSLLEGDLIGVVSIKRHPLDVVLSSINYASVHRAKEVFPNGEVMSVEDLIAAGRIGWFLDRFIEDDGFSWFASQSGTFSIYQQLWRDYAARLPYLELCYEDMFADPAQAVLTLAGFLEVPCDIARARKIVKVGDEGTQPDGGFYWKRRAYNFEGMLPPDVAENFNHRIAPVLESLGYDHPTRPRGA